MHICAAAHGMWGTGMHVEESGLCQLLTGPAGGDGGGPLLKTLDREGWASDQM